MSFLSARSKAGLSQAAAAEKLGVAPAAVSQWETGRTSPRAPMLVKVANLYGCTTDELLTSFEGGIESGEAEQNGHSADP